MVVPAGVQGPGDRGIPGKAIAQFSSRRAQITKGTLALAHEYDGRGHAAEPGRKLLPAGEQASAVVRIHNGRDYRFSLVSLPAADGVASTQAIIGDVTEERRERRLATRYAALVVQVEEDQRRPQVQVGIQGQEAADPGAVLMDQSKGPIRCISRTCVTWPPWAASGV